MVLTYSTKFPIAHQSTPQDVLDVVIGWFLPESELQTFKSIDFEGTYRFDNREIEVCKVGDYYGGARLTQVVGDTTTITDVIGARTIYPHVCVREEVSEDITHAQQRRKPSIVYELIHWLGEGIDGNTFPVTTFPINPAAQDQEYIALALNGLMLRELPCIYLDHEITSSCADALAFQVSGMATVLHSPSKNYSQRLSDLLKQPHTSRATIYWPDGSAEYDNTATLDSVFERIKNGLLSNDIHSPTFPALLSLSRMESNRYLKGKLAATQEECVQLFSDKLDFLKVKINRLQSEIDKPSTNTNTEGIAEFYKGECAEIIIDALKSYERTLPLSRRKDIVAQLISNNPASGERKLKLEKIKSLLHGDFNMNKERTISALRRLGLEIIPGPHPQIYIPGYENRKVTIPSTSGDRRTGKNIVSTLQNELM